MDRQKTMGNLQLLQRQAAKRLKLLLASEVLQKSFHTVLALTLSAAQLADGMAPFGLAYAACQKKENLFAAAGAFVGYLLFYGTDGMVYAASALICAACSVIFRDIAAAKQLCFQPLCAALALICTKGVIALPQGARGIILLLCEAAVCGGFCLLYAAFGKADALPRWTKPWVRLALPVSLLLVLQPLRVLQVLAPARILACILLMAAAGSGGSALGAAMGVGLGACMDLAAGSGPFFAAVYGFAALAAGAAKDKGRFVSTVCYVVANGLASAWGGNHPCALPGLYECFAASVCFILLPDSWLAILRDGLGVAAPASVSRRTAGQRAFAAGRLQSVSKAVGELAEAMAGLWDRHRKDNPADISHLFDRAADSVCRSCALAGTCWNTDYLTTFDAFNQVIGVLQSQHQLTPQDFPQHFVARCIQLPSFCAALNDEYKGFLRRRANQRRSDAARDLMRQQYEGLQGVLQDVAAAAGDEPEFLPTLQTRVRAIAKAYVPHVKTAVYTQAGRMHAELILPPEVQELPDEQAFVKSLSLALDKTFLPPKTVLSRSGTVLRFSERERFTASIQCTVRKKHGQQVCGDTHTHLHTEDGRAIVLLSDGMGTGETAGARSGKALELICSFAKAGCSLVESTRAVLPVLAARFEEWGFVTLDLLEINLFTGQAQLLKYGAAPSFLLRDGKLLKIHCDAMPAGLEQELACPARPAALRLREGDRIVMLSDGVWENGDTQQLLQEKAADQSAALGSDLILAAVRGGAVDDMTVLTVQLSKSGE